MIEMSDRSTVDGLDGIGDAVVELARGRPVLVVDDADRENEGDLIVAGGHATTDVMALMVRHGTGIVCAAMSGEVADRLRLPPMVATNEDPKATAYTVSVDARGGITTGVSAADRSTTLRVLTDPASTANDLQRPGHIFPLRAVPGGVLQRRGHTESAVDLCRLAGLPPVAAICELVNDDGTMMRGPHLVGFARRHELTIVSVADLVRWRLREETHVERVADAALPTEWGRFTAVGYRSTLVEPGREAVALVMGEPDAGQPVLVRLHSECLTGDVFTSLRCDCGGQLSAAMRRIGQAGRGVIVYLRGHEGRGIGLLNKLLAYRLQDQGLDTVQANLALGLPADTRDYTMGAHVLRELGVGQVRLLTNNPAKCTALQSCGLTVVAREPLQESITADNLAYLRTKRDRLGHQLTGIDDRLPGAAATGTQQPERS